MEQLGSHLTYFHEIWYLNVLRKYVEKINVSLKSDKNNGYLTWRPVYIFEHISLSSSWNEKCFIQNQNTHFMFNTFFSKIVSFKTMWENTVQSDRPQMPIRRMRLACWITKFTDRHTGYIILIVSHGNHGCTKAPQCYIIRALLSRLSSDVVCVYLNS